MGAMIGLSSAMAGLVTRRASSIVRGLAPFVGASGAMAPGIIVAILAFGAYDRTYHYVPLDALVAMAAFAGIFATTVLFATQKGPDVHRVPPVVAVTLLGLGLGVYGFAGWKLSSFGLLLFTVPSLIAYVIVTKAAAATMLKRFWWVAILASLATVFFFLPSLRAAHTLYSTEMFLPEILRETVITSFLALLHSCTMLGIAVSLLGRSEDPQHDLRSKFEVKS